MREQKMIRMIVVLGIMLLGTVAHANETQSRSFYYTPFHDFGDDGVWMEFTVWKYEFAEIVPDSDSIGGGETICKVFVSPILGGTDEANLVDMESVPDGILFGTWWITFEEFEEFMRLSNCKR